MEYIMNHFRFFLLSLIVLTSATYVAVKYPNFIQLISEYVVNTL